jgi:hypothetical protein
MDEGQVPVPTEESFLVQYQRLNDAELRDIASGSTPWMSNARTEHPARMAARRVLLERGAPDVPRVPSWDINAGRIPSRIRWLVILSCLALCMLAGAVCYTPIDKPLTEASACKKGRALMADTGFSHRYQLTLTACGMIDSSPEGAVDGKETFALLFEGCIKLTERDVSRLKKRDSLDDCFRVRAFMGRDQSLSCTGSVKPNDLLKPGRYCTSKPVRMVEVISQRHRPAIVRVAAPPVN